MNYSIAIDGPAGSGKSTIAFLLAKELKFDYLNSGSLYRTIAYFVIKNNLENQVPKIFNKNFFDEIKIDWNPEMILLNNIDITKEIRSPECSNLASQFAVYPEVRDFVNKIIASISKSKNIIVDGRDIGTLVLPKATIKIFLDASIDVRAERIHNHNLELNIKNKSLDQIKKDVKERDDRDYNRKIAPLAQAIDAIRIDCSFLNPESIVQQIMDLFNERILHAR
ncbi:MAG: (d)CMP kinase [Mycoplasma sp.]